MNISIVSGTYNRIEYLKNMMQSARACIPRGLDHEFVIVDGGSDDGSLEWLREQADTVLIEDGNLVGAISAFTRGAFRACGDYVVMANDDIAFHPGSITAALVHLENNPRCGAVAFQDNRPIYENYPRDHYKTQMQCIETVDGEEWTMPYAQVGMFRKWLGDAAGWWGANDEIMSKARKYGGDNFLSARIVEEGYTIDELPTARCEDHVANDVLRLVDNQSYGGQHTDSKLFRRRFPNCAKFPAAPRIESPQSRQLRILYLPIYEPGHPVQHANKRGLRKAFRHVGLVWEIDYLNTKNISARLPQIIRHWQPDLLFTQLHDARTINAGTIKACKAAYEGLRVVNWHGDATRQIAPSYQALMREIDLQLIVDAAGLKQYETETHYWQVSYEEPAGDLPNMPAYDIVFLGNNYNAPRQALYETLRGTNASVGIYGRGWQQADGQNLYDFAPGVALYKNARLAVGDTFPGTSAFVSNRFFQVLAVGGAMMMQQITPDFETHNPGLIDGEHYIGWRDLNDLKDKLTYWLDGRRESRRTAIAKAAQEIVVKNYSFDAQVKKLWIDIFPEVFK
jgi:glycosyltransferase involved in cell wall biosynthesis